MQAVLIVDLKESYIEQVESVYLEVSGVSPKKAPKPNITRIDKNYKLRSFHVMDDVNQVAS